MKQILFCFFGVWWLWDLTVNAVGGRCSAFVSIWRKKEGAVWGIIANPRPANGSLAVRAWKRSCSDQKGQEENFCNNKKKKSDRERDFGEEQTCISNEIPSGIDINIMHTLLCVLEKKNIFIRHTYFPLFQIQPQKLLVINSISLIIVHDKQML